MPLNSLTDGLTEVNALIDRYNRDENFDPRLISANAQAGTSYTLALADAGKVVELTNAAAVTLTIPAYASVAFPAGTVIELFQGGAGQVTINDSAVTLRAPDGKKLAKQYASASLRHQGAGTWVLAGNVTV